MSKDRITVKKAGREDARQARDILKIPLRRFGMPKAIWMAYLESRELPVGAACGWVLGNEGRGWIRVEEKHRRKGIGKALMAAMEDESKKGGLVSIRPARMAAKESTAFLKAMGFEEEFTLTLHKVSLKRVFEITDPLMKRLKKRSRIPDGAEIVSLAELRERGGLIRATAALIARNLGGHPRRILGRVAGKLPGFDPELTLIVLLDGRPIGILSSNYNEQAKRRVFPSIAVAPRHRSGWVNLWLRHEWCKRAMKADHQDDLYFDVRDTYKDTVKFIERLKGEPVGESRAYLKKL